MSPHGLTVLGSDWLAGRHIPSDFLSSVHDSLPFREARAADEWPPCLQDWPDPPDPSSPAPGLLAALGRMPSALFLGASTPPPDPLAACGTVPWVVSRLLASIAMVGSHAHAHLLLLLQHGEADGAPLEALSLLQSWLQVLEARSYRHVKLEHLASLGYISKALASTDLPASSAWSRRALAFVTWLLTHTTPQASSSSSCQLARTVTVRVTKELRSLDPAPRRRRRPLGLRRVRLRSMQSTGQEPLASGGKEAVAPEPGDGQEARSDGRGVGGAWLSKSQAQALDWLGLAVPVEASRQSARKRLMRHVTAAVELGGVRVRWGLWEALLAPVLEACEAQQAAFLKDLGEAAAKREAAMVGRGMQELERRVADMGTRGVEQLREAVAGVVAVLEEQGRTSEAEAKAQRRAARLTWLRLLETLASERGPWGAQSMIVYWTLDDGVRDALGRRSKLRRNEQGSRHEAVTQGGAGGTAAMATTPRTDMWGELLKYQKAANARVSRWVRRQTEAESDCKVRLRPRMWRVGRGPGGSGGGRRGLHGRRQREHDAAAAGRRQQQQEAAAAQQAGLGAQCRGARPGHRGRRGRAAAVAFFPWWRGEAVVVRAV